MMTMEASVIWGAATRLRMSNRRELAERMGLIPQTLCAQFKNPEGMSLRTIRQYVAVTGMSDEEIIRLVRGKT